MKELIGVRCAVVFNLPALEWPFPGYPAWLYVYDVDMPMVKLGDLPWETKWVNVSIIKTINPPPPSNRVDPPRGPT